MKAFIRALRHPRDYSWLELRPFQRHSLVVGGAGVTYMLLGSVYVITEPGASRLAGLKLALDIAPIQAWGLLWVVCGFLALLSARWPPASEKWGYTILTALALWWSTVYTLGVFFADSPASTLSGGLVWGLVAFLWWGIAGLANPDALVAMAAHPDSWAPTEADTEPEQ